MWLANKVRCKFTVKPVLSSQQSDAQKVAAKGRLLLKNENRKKDKASDQLIQV